MKKKKQKSPVWLFPVTLILLVLTGVTFSLAAGVTYSWKSESPDHTLTYTEGKLTWDNATGIREDGTAELSLFQALYQNVEADNGDKVIAPGTAGGNTIRLISEVDGPVHYTALVYEIKSSEELPVTAAFAAEGASDTDAYMLPQGVEPSQVIRAVEGTLSARGLQEFDIEWLWNFEDGEAQDILDTALGDQAALEKADDVQLGFVIVIEDENSYIMPELPGTGDSANPTLWLILAGASFAVLFFLLLLMRRKKEEEPDEQQR